MVRGFRYLGAQEVLVSFIYSLYDLYLPSAVYSTKASGAEQTTETN